MYVDFLFIYLFIYLLSVDSVIKVYIKSNGE